MRLKQADSRERCARVWIVDERTRPVSCARYANTMRLCGEGGSGATLTVEKPASRPISSNSGAVYASPRGVDASITKEKAAAKGGDTRSSLGTKSTASARPPELRLPRTFESTSTQVGGSKWWRKFVISTRSKSFPHSTSNALPAIVW